MNTIHNRTKLVASALVAAMVGLAAQCCSWAWEPLRRLRAVGQH
jgi:hypothetical protein